MRVLVWVPARRTREVVETRVVHVQAKQELRADGEAAEVDCGAHGRGMIVEDKLTVVN